MTDSLTTQRKYSCEQTKQTHTRAMPRIISCAKSTLNDFCVQCSAYVINLKSRRRVTMMRRWYCAKPSSTESEDGNEACTVQICIRLHKNAFDVLSRKKSLKRIYFFLLRLRCNSHNFSSHL